MKDQGCGGWSLYMLFDIVGLEMTLNELASRCVIV